MNNYDNIINSLLNLKTYCEAENFVGWDPYDGLNSKVFKATPFKHWDFARLAWIQGFKRSPINLRKFLLVPKQHNAKGIGLLLNGYCNLYKLATHGNTSFGTREELQKQITELADLLLKIQNNNYSGACWGYNFDWQSKAFFLPKNTPTIVATSFVVEALLEAYQITKDDRYLKTALSSADFILNDLNRIEKEDELFMFSYSPLDRQAVYNATLLGSKTLSLIYSYDRKEEYKNLAFKSAKAVCDLQNPDGSFPHSDQVGQNWRDNFHTGFKLESLHYYQKFCNDESFQDNIEKGFQYWKNNYFEKDTGFSYYYDRGKDSELVDLHCASQALTTFYKLDKMTADIELVEKIIEWPIQNMLSSKGYFYFQKKGNRINKIAYLRWPNAWMFYGMSYLLLYYLDHDKN